MLKDHDLALRHARPAELETLIALLNDLELRGEFLPLTLNSPQKMRQDFAENGFVSPDSERLMIVDREDRIVGMVRHFKTTAYYDAREIGYSLFDRAQHGRGLMTRAVRLLVDYLFMSQGLNRLEIRADVRNRGSIRVAEKLGFRFEGIARGAAFARDEYVDFAVYALVRADWRAGRQGH